MVVQSTSANQQGLLSPEQWMQQNDPALLGLFKEGNPYAMTQYTNQYLQGSGNKQVQSLNQAGTNYNQNIPSYITSGTQGLLSPEQWMQQNDPALLGLYKEGNPYAMTQYNKQYVAPERQRMATQLIQNPNTANQGYQEQWYSKNPSSEKIMTDIGMSKNIGERQGEELYGNKQDLAQRYQDVLQRRAQALEQGASPAEVASMRAEGQQQGQNLMAQQGRAGISGGVAMAQHQNVQNKTADRVATANTMAREKALADYSGDVGARLYGVVSGGLNTANMLQRAQAIEKGINQANQPY
jgi:hypothetical protein